MTTTNGTTQPRILVWQSGAGLRLRLATHQALNGGHPIDRSLDLPQFLANGRTLINQHDMRRGVVTSVAEHLAQLVVQNPDEDVIAYVGNGNLLANFNFVAWSDGRLYCLADEQIFRQQYTCIVNWTDGRVSVEDLRFGQENGRDLVLQKTVDAMLDITDDVEFVTSGQLLVRNGAAIPPELIAEQWYDTRHLLQPLRIAINGTALFFPNAQFQRGLQRKALHQPVHIQLEAQVDE